MRFILTTILLLAVAFAQEDIEITEPDVPTEIAPGITVTVNTAGADEPLQVAQDVIVYPTSLAGPIPYNREVVNVAIQLTSRVNTEVEVSTDNPEQLVARGEDTVRLPPGVTVSVHFTAFEPHSGSIFVYNTEGDLLEEIPYVVTKQSRVQQTVQGGVSTGVSTDFTELDVEPLEMSVGYGIRERESGLGGSAALDYEAGGNLDLGVSVTGSYSW